MESFQNVTTAIWNGKEVKIYSGYDRPMGWYFMVIEDPNEPDPNYWDEYMEPEEGLVYSNLLDANPSECDPEYFFRILDKLNIKLDNPEKLFSPY